MAEERCSGHEGRRCNHSATSQPCKAEELLEFKTQEFKTQEFKSPQFENLSPVEQDETQKLKSAAWTDLADDRDLEGPRRRRAKQGQVEIRKDQVAYKTKEFETRKDQVAYKTKEFETRKDQVEDELESTSPSASPPRLRHAPRRKKPLELRDDNKPAKARKTRKDSPPSLAKAKDDWWQKKDWWQKRTCWQKDDWWWRKRTWAKDDWWQKDGDGASSSSTGDRKPAGTPVKVPACAEWVHDFDGIKRRILRMDDDLFIHSASKQKWVPLPMRHFPRVFAACPAEVFKASSPP